MADFQNAQAQKIYSSSLSLIILAEVSDEELEHQLTVAKCIDEQRRLLLSSKVTFEDYLDAVEHFGINIDKYVAEVEQNLIIGLNDLRR